MNQNERSHDSRKAVRLHKLDELIRSGRCRSAAQAARELQIKSGRTILRDFDRLREMGAKLAYDQQARQWRYTDKSFVLPAMQMSEGELIAIFLAERLMRQYRGAPFEQQLHTAFAKIVEWLPEQVTIDLSAQGGAYTFEVGPTSEFDPAHYAALSQAIAERRTLEIEVLSKPEKFENFRANPRSRRCRIHELSRKLQLTSPLRWENRADRSGQR